MRSKITDDATDELRRRYKNARSAVPDVSALGPQQQHEFYELCEAPRIRGLPTPPEDSQRGPVSSLCAAGNSSFATVLKVATALGVKLPAEDVA
jgi:hypothetical protein